jgi:hypothetical protein
MSDCIHIPPGITPCPWCEIDRLRGLLDEYGAHHIDCALLTIQHEECDCGFSTALGTAVQPPAARRTQMHSSNPQGICDHCGHKIDAHVTGDYECPATPTPPEPCRIMEYDGWLIAVGPELIRWLR